MFCVEADGFDDAGGKINLALDMGIVDFDQIPVEPPVPDFRFRPQDGFARRRRLTRNRLEIRMGRCQNGYMKQLTAIIHQGEPDEGGFWATCLEVPGANGQGETKEECLGNLAEAVQLLLDTGREEAFRLDPQAETAELLLA